MYVVMVKIILQDGDVFHAEYSGEYHETEEAAKEELKKAKADKKMHLENNVDYCYIEEY